MKNLHELKTLIGKLVRYKILYENSLLSNLTNNSFELEELKMNDILLVLDFIKENSNENGFWMKFLHKNKIGYDYFSNYNSVLYELEIIET